MKSSLWTWLVFLVLVSVLPVHATAKPNAISDRAKSPRTSFENTVVPAATLIAVSTEQLSSDQLSISLKVLTGHIPCELGASVSLIKDERSVGRFLLSSGRNLYSMEPVATSTGAVRLEDPSSGAVWIQVANKSMLMNQKVGRALG